MNKVKILFLAANPAGTSKLNLDEEFHNIINKIRASEYRDSLQMISAWAVRSDDLLQLLNEHKPHIVHFSGHGNSQGELTLVDESGTPKVVSTQALKALFTTLKDNIRLVVLNACYTELQASAIAEIVDCVVGMSNAIEDRAAVIFAASFYRGIGFGRSIQQSFEQGIAALLLEGMSDPNTPRLLIKETLTFEEGTDNYRVKTFVPSYALLGRSSDHPVRSASNFLSQERSLIETNSPTIIDDDSIIDILNSFSANFYPGMMYCDIDGLLGINKVYGNDIGDEVIRSAGQIIKKCAGDNVTFRFRGEQFIVLLKSMNILEAMKFAETAKTMILGHQWSSIGHDIYITCTFCVAEYRYPEVTGRWLLRAILSLKEAKKHSPNQVVRASPNLPSMYETEIIQIREKVKSLKQAEENREEVQRYKSWIYYSSS